MRKPVIAGLSLLGVLTVLLLGMVYLVVSESGLQTAYFLAGRLLPGELSIKFLHGRLLGPLEIGDLHFSDGQGKMLDLASLSLAWRPSELLDGVLHIASLHLEGVTFASGPASDEKTELSDITLPVAVQVDDLQVSDIRINNPGKAPPLLIDKIASKAFFTRDDELQLANLEVKAALFQLALKGRLRPQGDYPLNLQTSWAVTQEAYKEVSGAGSLTGTLRRQLKLVQNIDKPFTADLNASVADVLTAPGWDVDVQLSDFDARELNSDWPDATASGHITSHGTVDDFTAQGKLDASSPDFGALLAGFDVRGANGRIVLDKLKLSVPKTETQLEAKATFTTSTVPIGITASADWHELAWPLAGIADYASPGGTLEVTGSLADYKLQLNADVAGRALPKGHWNMQATGNQQALKISSLQAATLDGLIKAAGTLAWAPTPSWQLALQGDTLNPGAHWPDWPGRISFRAGSSGNEDVNGVLSADSQIDTLSGQLRDYPVAAQARIKIAGDHYQVPQLQVSSGTASLIASGDVQKNWDLNWRLEVPDLKTVLADGRGAVHSAGQVSGPLKQPLVKASIKADGLAFQDKRLDRLVLQADIDPLGTTVSQLTLDGQGLQFGQVAADNVTVRGSGTPASHQLAAQLEAPFENLDLALQGGWVDQQWTGEFSRFRLQTTGFGNWALEQPTPVQVSATAAQVPQLCVSGAGRFCIKGNWRKTGDSAGTVLLKDIPLALAQPFLPPAVSELTGTVSADADVQYDAAGQLTGDAVVNLSAGSLSYPDKDGKPLPIRYAGGKLLAATLDRQGGRGELLVDLTDLGALQGSFSLPQLKPLAIVADTQPVTGSVQLRLDKLGLAENFVPNLAQLQGLIAAKLDIGGVLARPDVHAAIDIEGVKGVASGQPIDISGQVQGLVEGEHYSVSRLEISSGTARLSASGDVQENWNVNWNLAAPDLRNVYPALAGALQLEGRINGPRDTPAVSARVDARTVSYQDSSLASLQGSIDVDLLGVNESRLNLQAQDMLLGGRKVDSVSLQGSGKPQQHQLSAAVKTAEQKLDLALKGGWVNQQWAGELSRLVVEATGYGNWALDRPAMVQASAAGAKVPHLCLSGKGSLCIDGAWQKTGDSAGTISLKDIPLALAQPFLPPDITDLTGTVSADTDVQYSGSGQLAGNTVVNVSNGSLSYPGKDGKPVAIRYENGKLLDAVLDKQGAHGELGLTLTELGNVQGTFSLPQLDPLVIIPATQAIAGKLALKLDKLALAERFVPDLEKLQGLVDARLDISGTLAKPKLAASADIEHVKGVASGQPVDLSGELQALVDGQHYSVSKLDLTSGTARLRASGDLAERWDVSYMLAAPNLKSVYPGLAGALQVDGKISGLRDKPAVALTVNGKSLAYQDTRIASLDGSADVDLLGASESRLKLDARDMLVGGRKVQRLMVQGSGKPEQHQLTATLTAADESLDMALSGAWKNSQWSGKLSKTSLQSRQFGNWSLAEPVAIQASAEQASLGQLCITGKGRLCAKGEWRNGGKGMGDVSLRDIPLALAQPFLPEHVDLTGDLQGTAKVNYSAAGVITGEALFELPSGSASYPLEEGSSKRTVASYRDGRLQVNADGKGARGELKLAIVDAGEVQGSFSLPKFGAGRSSDPAKQPLTGRLRAHFGQLDLIARFVPALGEVKGLVDVDLDVAGTVAAPQLTGVAAFRNGAIDVTSTGIKVREINIEARSQGGQTLQIQGSARSGAGSLSISGQLAVDPAAGFPATVHITGDRFQVADLTEAKAIISPDLTVRKTIDRIEVTGEVVIPEATIRELKSTGGPAVVQVSDDVVIINTDKKAAPRATGGLGIHARVRVVLGDRVRVDAYGFKGNIAGSILVDDQPDGEPTGTGQLHVTEGTYKAYGQDLAIGTGNILFNGGPVDNPGLDVSATRTVEAITAGVRVRGTVKQPELTLFSTPAMDDANALSYLLLGRPLNQLSGGEGSALFQAASTLGLKGGNALAKRIGSTFGLEEVGIESTSSGSGSGLGGASLVLGKYLSPRLYVQYGVGLFNSGSVVRIRYKLTKHFSIQTETGRGSGGDLLYSIER